MKQKLRSYGLNFLAKSEVFFENMKCFLAVVRWGSLRFAAMSGAFEKIMDCLL